MSEAPAPIRLFLVDDHTVFRQSFAMVVETVEDMVVVGDAATLAEARQALASSDQPIDVALLDLDLPDGSGTELIDDLIRGNPDVLPLVLTAHTDEMRLAGAIEGGAAGVCTKFVEVDDILGAIRRLAAGELLLSPDQISSALRLVGRARRESHETTRALTSLTARERDVLQAVAEGLSDRDIAEKLTIGIGTVKTHTKSILAKLGVNSRLQALVLAARHDAVDLSPKG